MNKKKIVIMILILIMFMISLYLLSPAEYAIDITQVDEQREYLICNYSTATDLDYNIVYDSKNRDMQYVKIKDRQLNTTNSELFNQTYTLNSYILFPENYFIDYTNGIMEIDGKCNKNLIYPIKREGIMTYILPKSYLCKFETWL